MSIGDLAQRVEMLAKRARDYEEVFRRSEAAVRSSLIEPFLRLMGWDTEDPTQVRPEFSTQSGRPDYALLGEDGSPLIFVGAKALGRQEDLMQYISYCVSQGVRYFVATDGVQWEVYDTSILKPLPEKLVTSWNIVKDPPVEVLRKAFVIARGIAERREAPRPVLSSSEVPPAPMPTKSEEPPRPLAPQLTLARLKSARHKPPFTLVFPDGQRYEIETWTSLLTSVVDWLIKTGRLTEKNLPLRAPRATKRYIVHKIPKHPTGSDFYNPKKVSDVYVETHFSSKGVKDVTCFVLREFGVDPESVVLEMKS